jgi:hypothetical protein
MINLGRYAMVPHEAEELLVAAFQGGIAYYIWRRYLR